MGLRITSNHCFGCSISLIMISRRNLLFLDSLAKEKYAQTGLFLHEIITCNPSSVMPHHVETYRFSLAHKSYFFSGFYIINIIDLKVLPEGFEIELESWSRIFNVDSVNFANSSACDGNDNLLIEDFEEKIPQKHGIFHYIVGNIHLKHFYAAFLHAANIYTIEHVYTLIYNMHWSKIIV